MTLTLLAAQISVPRTPTRAARDAHVARVAARIEDALAQRTADLVVLPELSTIDYARESFDQLATLADPIDQSPCLQTLGAVAQRHGVHMVVGLPRRATSGFRICMAVLGPDGSCIAHYDKLHICHYGASMEKDYFARGDQLAVFDVAGIRCAPIICYDIRFPELTRTLCVERGVQLVLHCGAYAQDESCDSWAAFVTTRAMENQCFVLSLNRAGENWGGSMFAGPWVDSDHPLTTLGTEETLRYFQADPAEIDRVRTGYSFLKDRLHSYDL